jgi:transporter family protein
MQLLLLVLLTGIFYGIYNFFIKVASGSINQILGAVILQIIAAILGSAVLIYLKITGQTFNISSNGIKFSILAGLFVGLAEITSFIVFSKGLPASTGIAIIVGTTVLIGSILGGIFLREALTPYNYLGLVLTIIGIALLSLKPQA